MVDGIESFRDTFKEFSDCYTVIGGAACDILMSEQDVEFRATHDIDMILILEDKKKEFSSVFWKPYASSSCCLACRFCTVC